ncbi:hypothetical protein [Peribacillus frigoritolerans]|uniref:hypothetical protein n=1 Tax=Peribacillus frigoritolerans TaxID=450367 RepID=UPI003DA0A2FB
MRRIDGYSRGVSCRSLYHSFFQSVQKASDESEAEFGNSWDLLSSKIKLRFPNRADYVQNRSHVFLQHMNVKSFQYDLQADT